MPTKDNLATKTAQRPRRNIHAGANNRKLGCKRSVEPSKATTAVIANSLFALTLRPKENDEVPTFGQQEQNDKVDYGVMYKDLKAAYNYGADAFGKKRMTFNDNCSPVYGVKQVLHAFKENILPKDWSVNIAEHYKRGRKEETRYHFCIYKFCKFPDYWHFFEVKPIIEKLRKENRKLHDFFVVFMASLIAKCGLPTWYNGGMNESDFYLPDHLCELAAQLDILKEKSKDGLPVKVSVTESMFEETPIDEQIKDIEQRISEIHRDVHIYEKGEAYKYGKLFEKTKPRSVQSLLKSLQQFSPNYKIVQFMKSACELMEYKAQLVDFCYEQVDGDDYEALRFDQQVTIVWNMDDHFTNCHTECKDAMVRGCGLFPPIIHARILPGSFSLDVKELMKAEKWTLKVSELFQQFLEINNKLKPNE